MSNSNIGRGKVISNMIMEFLEDNRGSIIGYMEGIAGEKSKLWCDKCHAKISELLKSINEKCTAVVNSKLSEPLPENIMPMSSTVIIGFVNKNRVSFGYLGDSHLFYINNDSIMRLTEDHNLENSRISQHVIKNNKKVFSRNKNDKHLEAVLPLCVYDNNNNIFKIRDIEKHIDFVDIYLKNESSIIVATDGLIDSVKNSEMIIITKK